MFTDVYQIMKYWNSTQMHLKNLSSCNIIAWIVYKTKHGLKFYLKNTYLFLMGITLLYNAMLLFKVSSINDKNVYKVNVFLKTLFVLTNAEMQFQKKTYILGKRTCNKKLQSFPWHHVTLMSLVCLKEIHWKK